MKTIKILCLALLCMMSLFFASSCSNKPQLDANRGKEAFFASMDGYVAAGEYTHSPLALTMFFSKNTPPFQLKEIVNIQFANINEDIIVADLVTARNDFEAGAQYDSYSFSFNALSDKTGVYETDTIELYFSDNTVKSYSIGNWVFDIGEQEDSAATEILDTWQSPVATSSGDAFTYDYIPKNQTVKIKKLWYGKETYIESEDSVSFADSISLKNKFDAPLNYIKTKLEVELDGKTFIVYGKGCYCGAYNFQEDVLKSSQNRE